MLTAFSEDRKISQNQIKAKNYNATYEDVAKVFSKIKNKGILNETMILNGQAEYKTDRITSQKSNKNTKRKSKKNVKREEEFEL